MDYTFVLLYNTTLWILYIYTHIYNICVINHFFISMLE